MRGMYKPRSTDAASVLTIPSFEDCFMLEAVTVVMQLCENAFVN